MPQGVALYRSVILKGGFYSVFYTFVLSSSASELRDAETLSLPFFAEPSWLRRPTLMSNALQTGGFRAGSGKSTFRMTGTKADVAILPAKPVE
ncbi:hypothetical protein X736_31655 [Mesorhizobium sp. L2C089B000]|nr:hypothetical protein X736_31655 [Mesorhizobium sp. L2C089B000]